MRWRLDEERAAFVDSVRDALAKAEDGWAVLEDIGGVELDDIEVALLAEEAGRACVPGPVVETIAGEDPDRRAFAAAAYLVGLAQAMLDMAVQYAGFREQFGRAIGSFQALRNPLADVATGIAHARPTVLAAAWALAAKSEDRGVRCSAAKVLASQAAERCARVALQTHGAMGYTTEHQLHRWLNRTWRMSRAFGDPAFHRRRIGAVILRRQETT
jgi:hypothetical protein